MHAPSLARHATLAFLFAAAPLGGVQDPGSPAPAGKAGAASAPSLEEARALFAKVVEGLGGAQRLAAVKDVRIRAHGRIRTPQGDVAVTITQVNVFPDRQQQEIDAPFGRITTVFTPKAAFTVDGNGVQDLPPAAREDQARETARSPLLLARRAGSSGLALSIAGRETLGGVEVAILDVSCDGAQTRWLVDPATGRILRTSYTATGGEGKVKRSTDYSDFRSVDGMTFAFRQESSVNGETSQWITLEEVEINSSPDPRIFEKPVPRPFLK